MRWKLVNWENSGIHRVAAGDNEMFLNSITLPSASKHLDDWDINFLLRSKQSLELQKKKKNMKNTRARHSLRSRLFISEKWKFGEDSVHAIHFNVRAFSIFIEATVSVLSTMWHWLSASQIISNTHVFTRDVSVNSIVHIYLCLSFHIWNVFKCQTSNFISRTHIAHSKFK